MTDKSLSELQLELGGSFFELIEFSLTRNLNGKVVKGVYGVNVAKVREVVRMPKINPLSSRIKGVAGIFELRGVPIPAVHLAMALGDPAAELQPNQQVIVTEFSQKRAGFVVDLTHRIRRVAWDKVLPPSADAGTCINGMTLIDKNEFLFILDLERILITLEFGGQLPDTASYVPHGAPDPRGAKAQLGAGNTGARLLLVDDSQFIRNGARQTLLREGYRVTEANDGAEALRMIEESYQAGQPYDLIVTDVEMPRMDGFTLTRKIRENPTMAELPVLLHTSLSGKTNQAAGISVGANGYVIKNDFKTLMTLIREILGGGAARALSA